MKIYHVITALQRLIGPRQMASLKETSSKIRFFSSIATVRTGSKVVVRLSGMLLLRTEMSNTSWQMGKLRMKDDLENHSNIQEYLVEHWLNTIRFHHKTKHEFINLARKYYLGSFLAMSWSRGDFGKEIFLKRIWKIWKSWMHQKFILEESTRKRY